MDDAKIAELNARLDAVEKTFARLKGEMDLSTFFCWLIFAMLAECLIAACLFFVFR